MAGKDQNSYGSQGQTNYAPDRQNNYQKNPPPTPEEAYQAKHDNRFTKQLSTVAAQEAYNNQKNILPTSGPTHKPGDADKVADVLADYVDGFNKTHLRLRFGPPGGRQRRRRHHLPTALPAGGSNSRPRTNSPWTPTSPTSSRRGSQIHRRPKRRRLDRAEDPPAQPQAGREARETHRFWKSTSSTTTNATTRSSGRSRT